MTRCASSGGTQVSPVLETTLEPGDNPVDSAITCVITRFGLRGRRHLLRTAHDYRRVSRDAARSPGPLQSAFLIERPSAAYTLSIWRDMLDIPRFGSEVPTHVEAARRVFGRLSFDPERGPELWSTKWKLVTVSNNLNWGEFDLRMALQCE